MMAKAYLFYNPLAGGGQILEDLELLEFVLDAPCIPCDLTKPETYCETLFSVTAEDCLVICGGDGTLHRFVNLTRELNLPNEILYYPAGEHNDFARNCGCGYGSNPFSVTRILKRLPSVRAGNRTGCFLAGILFEGCGRIRRTSKGSVDYTDKNTPQSIRITVDGKTDTYDRVRLAAVLRGKYCAGMCLDPQKKHSDGKLACVLVHGCGPLRARYLMRRFRKGKPLSGTGNCTILRGADVHLAFDGPVTLHMDGEPVKAAKIWAGSMEEKENL